MKLLGVAVLCLLAGASAAYSSGFGDFNSGVAAANRGEREDAIKALTRAISSPDLPAHLLAVAHLARGQSYDFQKNYDAAIADYTAAIALKKDYAEAYLERCGTYEIKKLIPQALADCASAIQIQPDNWRLYETRIGINVRAKRFDDALADYTRFVAKRPNNLDLRLEQAELLRTAGRLDEALATATAAQSMAPKFAGPHMELGLIHLARNDLSNALASFDKVTSLVPKYAIGYLLKGQIEWAMGRFGDAIDSFEDSLDEDEQQKYAFLWLSIARARNGKQPETRMARRFEKMDLVKWPGPMVSLYLDKATPEAALKVDGDNDDTGDRYTCMTDFFVGEWYVIHGNPAEARRLLGQTASACEHDWKTARLAAIDLARLP